ncbi:alpha/beta fold hydrolase [Nonomuraea sp. NPDC050643]|uniref:alpha/beta fold hydrolase n=1 Tax=Nonomuraea sp. NPDC050643 TaxID=3155660 RepID=UPI0033ED6894
MTHNWKAILCTLLAGTGATVGVWAAFWPERFFTSFPLSAWAARPYNEYLTRDFGGLTLALAVVTALAALSASEKVFRGAGAAWLTFGVLHLAWNLGPPGTLSTGGVAALSVPLLAALALIIPARAAPRPRGGTANLALTGRTRRGLAFTQAGVGPPLVLLHGNGSSRSSWRPVFDRLTDTHTVYALDLPGFGDSVRLEGGLPSTPRNLAEAVATALDEWDLDAPHVAGHSVGGWVALELAGLRQVASLTLLSPAGLWKRSQPAYCAVSLLLTWAACRFSARPISALARWAWVRRLLFWQLFAHPEKLTHEDVIRDVATMGRCPGFLPTLWAVRNIRYRAARDMTAPVTLAFGASDRLLLTRQSRFTDQLPPHTRHVLVPGAGHVPMSDAPELVSRTILATTGTVTS